MKIRVKGISMLSAISAMIILMSINGVETGIVEIILFPLFNVIVIFSLVLIIRNLKEPVDYRKREL